MQIHLSSQTGQQKLSKGKQSADMHFGGSDKEMKEAGHASKPEFPT